MTEEDIVEQINGLRDLAESLTGKKLGNVKDPMKLQLLIDEARKEEEPEKSETGVLSKAQKRAEARKKATKLVRVNVTAMSPFEKQLKGAFFDVGNNHIGAVRRYVPFDVDWHVEVMLVKHLRGVKYRTKREYTDPTTRKTVYENVFHNSFGVVELQKLSDAEMTKHLQAMKAREYG